MVGVSLWRLPPVESVAGVLPVAWPIQLRASVHDLHDVSLRVATVRDGSGRQCGARAPHRLYYAIGAARRLVVHSTRLHDVHL